ncbi:zinc finger protein 391-like isoform X1 [Corythoichthys intestinalis]|uniref:zinc finger protein 391-like isoform X1 n=1 Tax=Corythoichthys intestinalis TaxID=161448 RepID=UPI0025A4F902|nr:zinc finger protein 391-like isoform X1 [Corythoichthys intestinalis]
MRDEQKVGGGRDVLSSERRASWHAAVIIREANAKRRPPSVMDGLKPPQTLCFDTGSLSKTWKTWREEFLLYTDLTCDERKKVELFRHLVGESGRELLDKLMGEIPKDRWKIEDIIERFDDHCNPGVNETVERYRFFTRNQGVSETIDSYFTELKLLSKTCNFDTLRDSLIRDRIVCGHNNAAMRGRLLREKNLTLDTCIQLCRAAEWSRENNMAISESMEEDVHAVQGAACQTNTTAECISCGRKHEMSTQKCPAYDVSPAHLWEHQESACIKEEEEEESPSIVEDEMFIHMEGSRKYLGAERQEQESPGVKKDVQLPQIKEEEPEPCQQKEREKQLPIKKEEEELPFNKEGEGITRSTGEPLNSEDGPSEASRGAVPSSGGGSSSSTEGLQVDRFIAPLSDSEDATSLSPDIDVEGHKNNHSDDKLCKCSYCGKTFARKYNCLMHMRSHTGEKPFVCSVCGQTFTMKQHLNLHTRTHTGEKPFSCSFCGQGFTQKPNLKRHELTHTGEKPFSCSVCDQRFSLKKTLQDHVRTHTGEKKNSCLVCGQTFGRKQHLKQHTRTHTGEKPFSCLVCGERFTIKNNMEKHTRTHTGEKPFTCSVCGQRFTRKDSLKIHTRNHTGEKPFSCSDGGQRFSLKKTLQSHGRTHTGEKPFPCSVVVKDSL